MISQYKAFCSLELQGEDASMALGMEKKREREQGFKWSEWPYLQFFLGNQLRNHPPTDRRHCNDDLSASPRLRVGSIAQCKCESGLLSTGMRFHMLYDTGNIALYRIAISYACDIAEVSHYAISYAILHAISYTIFKRYCIRYCTVQYCMLYHILYLLLCLTEISQCDIECNIVCAIYHDILQWYCNTISYLTLHAIPFKISYKDIAIWYRV